MNNSACRPADLAFTSQLHRPALETSKVSADASPISFSNFSCQKSRVSPLFPGKNLNKSGKNLALNIQVFWGVANFAWLIGANVQNFIWGFRSFFFVLILCILKALFSTNIWLFCFLFVFLRQVDLFLHYLTYKCCYLTNFLREIVICKEVVKLNRFFTT